MFIDVRERARLLETARGERPADLFVRGGSVANVYSGELLPGNVAVCGDRIAYVGRGEHAIGPETVVVEAQDMVVSPGFIEAHNHPWVLYNPVTLAEGIVPLGTTTVVADNLFFFMQMGPEGFAAMADDLHGLPLRYLWVARLVSQAAFAGEEEMFAPEKIERLLDRVDVVGTAEVTRWPALAAGEPNLLAGISAAERRGLFSDGHTGGASEARLAEVAAAGIDADHEAISREEVLNRLRIGLWTMLRHSSLRRDLPELLRVVAEDGVSTQRLMLTTDGPAPEFVADNGFLDGMLRLAVETGVPPMQALQMTTLNPATFLRLDDQIGGIAPGRKADILLLPDLESFRPQTVITGGRVVAEDGHLSVSLPSPDWDRYGARPGFPTTVDLSDPGLYVARDRDPEAPVIHLRSNVITAAASREERPSAIHAALVDRHGAWVSHARVSGLADGVDALASTYNTTTHLLTLGRDPHAMARAADRVRELGGGIVVVRGESILYELALPVASMMSELPFGEVVQKNRELSRVAADSGYPHHDVLYTLLFLTCDFLPALRLTPRGLLDVKASRILDPSAPPGP